MASGVVQRAGAKIGEQGMLFEYTMKFLLLAGLLELILYRLVSRLGMHLAKVAEKHEWVGTLFQVLSSLGFILLNTVALLLFLALLIVLFRKVAFTKKDGFALVIIPSTSLLVLLTVAFLQFPPTMLASIVYNVVAFTVISVLTAQYLVTHASLSQRAFGLCFFLGISGWLYYQTMSTTYGLLGMFTAPPLAYEANRAGEALMVLASILVFWAYGWPGFFGKNKRHRRRVVTFATVGGSVFLALFFLDYFLGLYDRAMAVSVRQAGEGIGWIFQMGMGYSFYLPFALYVMGLLCWSYTVLKLVSMSRPAGYGVGLMFIAGYALQLSHLTLMVVLGLLLLNLDRRREESEVSDGVAQRPLVALGIPVVGEKGYVNG